MMRSISRRLGYYTNLITSGIGLTEARIAAFKDEGLGAFFVVIRGDEDQLARAALGLELLPVLIGDAFGTFELCAGR